MQSIFQRKGDFLQKIPKVSTNGEILGILKPSPDISQCLLFEMPNYWRMDPSFKSDWNCQLSRKCSCCFYLFYQVIAVYVGNGVVS